MIFCWKVTRTGTSFSPSIQSNLLRELDRYTLPSPKGSSKRYTNLVIWSRPRVNNCLCLLSHFQFFNFLPSVFLLQLLLAYLFYWKCLLGSQAVKFNCDCTSGFTGHSCLLPTVSSSTTAVLLNYSGCDCLLPTQVQLQLYFL